MIRTLVAAFDPDKAQINGSYLYDCQLRDNSEVELEKAKPYAKDKVSHPVRINPMFERLIVIRPIQDRGQETLGHDGRHDQQRWSERDLCWFSLSSVEASSYWFP